MILKPNPPRGSHDREYAGVLIVWDGHLILQERDDHPAIRCPGGITLFGGAAEGSEGFLDAAVRELQEELELEVEPSELKEIGYILKAEGDWSRTLCGMYSLRIDDRSQLVQHEGKGMLIATVDEALSHSKVSETTKRTIRTMVIQSGEPQP